MHRLILGAAFASLLAIPGPSSARAEPALSRSTPGNLSVLIFVHGVIGDARDTWKSSPSTSWPGLIASDHDFDAYDIYAQSFPSPPIGHTYSINELADLLNRDLEQLQVFDRYDKVYFVCHSMGGLVVRDFLLKYRERGYHASVPMVFFFATPTGGAKISTLARLLSLNPQFGDMVLLPNNSFLSSQQSDWSNSEIADHVRSYCAYELLKIKGFLLVVEQTSASLLCNARIVAIQADHLGIVKPKGKGDESYLALKQAVAESTIRFDAAHAAVELTTGNLAEKLDELRTGSSPHSYIIRHPLDLSGIAGSQETWTMYGLEFAGEGAIDLGDTQLNMVIRHDLVSSARGPVIVSYPPAARAAKDGVDGTHGAPGVPGAGPGAGGQDGQPGGSASAGADGRGGPYVGITVSRLPRGNILVDVRGQDGGKGGTGGDGGDGGPGAEGPAGIASSTRCEQISGKGGDGGNGGHGGAPGPGGRCGEGGLLILRAPRSLESHLQESFSVVQQRSRPGSVGSPGIGGSGGSAGKAGSAIGSCAAGTAGTQGSKGANSSLPNVSGQACSSGAVDPHFY